MSTKNTIIGALGGMTAGIILGIGIASKRSLTIRKKVIAKGDEYLSLILDLLNQKKGPISNELKQQLNERTINHEKPVKNPA